MILNISYLLLLKTKEMLKALNLLISPIVLSTWTYLRVRRGCSAAAVRESI